MTSEFGLSRQALVKRPQPGKPLNPRPKTETHAQIYGPYLHARLVHQQRMNDRPAE